MITTRTVGPGELTVHQSRGTGASVLLCHGNSLGGATFEPLLRSAVGLRYRLFALDLPGHGDSPDDPERYSMPALVTSILELADALELKHPVLVGHSLGGHLMTQVASRLDRLRGLLVCGAPLLSSPAVVPEAFLPHPAVGLLFKDLLDDDEVAALTGVLVPPGSAEADHVATLVRRADPRFRAAIARSLQGPLPDEVTIARELDVPVAILHGRADPLVRLDYLQQLRLPNLWRHQVQLIDGAGHLPQLQCAARFNQLVGAFLDEVR